MYADKWEAIRTTLGRTKVLSGSRGARLSTTSLLNAESPSFVVLTLQTFLCSIGLLCGSHIDEAESTRLSCMRIAHDVGLLNSTVLLEETSEVFFKQTRVDACDK
jgi:hypothetical protein